jgi:hypothetical protein
VQYFNGVKQFYADLEDFNRVHALEFHYVLVESHLALLHYIEAYQLGLLLIVAMDVVHQEHPVRLHAGVPVVSHVGVLVCSLEHFAHS